MYDLKLIPILQSKGKALPQGESFMAAAAPKRAVRSRAEDLLILSFSLADIGRVTPTQQKAWLNDLVVLFYKTSGSVTSALRTLIETFNITLMEKNLKSARSGAATTGSINAAAVHGRFIYVVQSGQTHAFTLTNEGLRQFHDVSNTDRGLGVSRTPSLRYFQTELGEGAYLFMTETPPATWEEERLILGGFPNLDQLRRRLLNQASPDFRLDLVQLTPGDGQIMTTPLAPADPEKVELKPTEEEELGLVDHIDEVDNLDALQDEPRVSDTQKVGLTEPEDEAGMNEEINLPDLVDEENELEIEEEAAGLQDESLNGDEAEWIEGEDDSLPDDDKAEDERLKDEDTSLSDASIEGQAAGYEQKEDKDREDASHAEHQTEDEPAEEKPVKPAQSSLKERTEVLRQESVRGLLNFFDWRHKTGAKANRVFKDLSSKVGLVDEHGASTLSNRTMLIIALVVPVFVVALALGIYLSRGRTLQYEYYLEQAKLASIVATTSEDPLQARQSWAEAVIFLDQAQSFRRTEEIEQKQAEAQRALDFLDGAARLSFHPVIAGTLADNVNITRMISYGLDLYLLDAANGQVIHATRSSKGYQVDPSFHCKPGNYGGGTVEALVDMVSLPINNPYQAHILAIDAGGDVIFCGPGIIPEVQTLPQGNRAVGAITRISAEGDRLYVLDPSADSLRVYWSVNGQFLDPPTEYFGGNTGGQKPALATIVDLAVNGSDLYLLPNSGKVINCVATGLPGNPVNCENPASLVDGRPGKEEQPVTMLGSGFVSILYTQPPAPAINILDGENADIFRFSVRFRLDKRLRSDFGDYELATPTATAFTIGVDRTAFIAFGNQVFYAYLE